MFSRMYQHTCDCLLRVLLLHLKRFRCTSLYKLEKAYDPIRLLENMVVYTTQVKRDGRRALVFNECVSAEPP